MRMMMFTLKDPNHLEAIVNAWRAIGAYGITVAETGDLPRRLIVCPQQEAWLFEPDNYTLWAIVPDERTALMGLMGVEEIVGNLTTSQAGIFVAWELALVRGVPAQSPELAISQ